jgi:hypothetical protein
MGSLVGRGSLLGASRGRRIAVHLGGFKGSKRPRGYVVSVLVMEGPAAHFTKKIHLINQITHIGTLSVPINIFPALNGGFKTGCVDISGPRICPVSAIDHNAPIIVLGERNGWIQAKVGVAGLAFWSVYRDLPVVLTKLFLAESERFLDLGVVCHDVMFRSTLW